MLGDARPKRRWFQFSIGGVLLLTGAVAAVMAFYVNRVQRQREVVALVEQHNGALSYDFQRNRQGRPRGPEWARKLLGQDFFSDLVHVRTTGIKNDEPRLTSIGSLKKLEMLNLRNCAAGDEVFRHFGDLTELRRLDLSGTKLSDAGLNKLDRLTKLQMLDLHQTRITDVGLRALRGMTELEGLDLSGTAISEVFRQFGDLTELRRLDLSGTKLSDAGLNKLDRLAKLQWLDLHQTRITDAGLQGLRGMVELNQLDLSGTAISDLGIEYMPHLPRLGYLNLNDTKVSDESLENLNGLPALVAVSLHGSLVTEAGLKRLKACGTLEKPTPQVQEVLLALTDRTELEFKNQPLSDVLEYFAERHNISIILGRRNWPSPSAPNEPKISADEKGFVLADALKAILEPLDMVYTVRYEALLVTMSPWRPKMRIQQSSELAASNGLLTKLDQPARALGFDRVPLGDLFLSIESQYGIQVLPDEAAFTAEGDVDEFLETIATVVDVINARRISRRSMLELTFDANALDCRIEGNALLVRPRNQKPADQE